MVFFVVSGGFFLGLVEEMKMLILGRFEWLFGFVGDGDLNFFFKILRFVILFMGFNFGSWFKIYEKVN